VAAVFSMALGVSAQSSGQALVTQALHDIGTNCANLALNTTCLAHASVQRTTSSGLVSTTYTQPGDRASITTTHKIATGALNVATGDFGVNVMKVQAGLGGGQGVVIIAFGGTTITNVGGAGQAVWQNISVSMSPVGGAPNFLLIQGPAGVAVTETVNGTPIEIHSTVAVTFGPNGEQTIYVVSGAIIINGVTITAGSKVTIAADGSVSVPALWSDADIAGLQIISLLPGNVLNYVPPIPVVVCPSGVGGAGCTTVGG
jgi:archaellum component FlaF (FlaF/FlaG flagellin family)